jgi:dTDP-4-dehydrorhamnose reductase
MLGRAFCELFNLRGETFRSLDLPELDIADPTQVQAVVEGGYRAVINCAAFTNVDAAETDEPAALRANGEGPRVVALACAARRVPLVHFSTDYVFAGDGARPYPVDAALSPQNAYGRTKAAGEIAIRESGAEHLILRTSWLYAPWANNFVRTIAKLSKERDSLKVVDDQRGRPTSAEHLARVSLALLDANARGIFHVTDGGECSWYELALEIARLAGSSCAIAPCTTAEFPRPAQRPAYSVLDLAPTERIVGPMPDWRDNLADVMARLE